MESFLGEIELYDSIVSTYIVIFGKLKIGKSLIDFAFVKIMTIFHLLYLYKLTIKYEK